MGAVPAARLGVQVRAHARFGVGVKPRAGAVVNVVQDAPRVRDEVGVPHVDDPIVRYDAVVAPLVDDVEADGRAVNRGVDDRVERDDVGVHPHEGGHEIRERRQHLHRIAVRDDDVGVGILGEERRQRSEVTR